MTETAKPDPFMQDAQDMEDARTEAEDAMAADPILAQIQQQAEEAAKYKDLYLRAMAETENVRARARRDLDDANKYAATKFARDIVGIVENLQRASASITPEARAGNETLKQVGDGIDMSMQELLSTLERHGIKRISPEGQKFDHNLHQAVAQVESHDAPPGTVLQVLQAGYSMHDRLLKPAMVTVASQPGKAADTSA